jgi:8-oxo-dGTP diphosphatase
MGGPEARTIGIGVGAVVFRDEAVLLILRARPPFAGHWSIPGGKPRYGEPLPAALAREVLEETGCSIRIGGLIDVFEALPGEPGGAAGHMVMADYWAEWTAGEPRAGDDAAAAEFVPIPEALTRLSWDKTRAALGQALKLRENAQKAL